MSRLDTLTQLVGPLLARVARRLHLAHGAAGPNPAHDSLCCGCPDCDPVDAAYADVVELFEPRRGRHLLRFRPPVDEPVSADAVVAEAEAIAREAAQ